MHAATLTTRHSAEARRAIANHRYEATASGIEIPSMKLAIGGIFEVAGNDGVWNVAPNLLTTEGLNYILGAALAQATQKLGLYLAIFSGNVTVVPTWTGANFAANATEITTYAETTRPLWDKGAVAAGSVSNTAIPAVFTMGAGTTTVRGVGLLGASAKGATTDVLVAAARLPVDKVMAELEELRAKYTLTATST